MLLLLSPDNDRGHVVRQQTVLFRRRGRLQHLRQERVRAGRGRVERLGELRRREALLIAVGSTIQTIGVKDERITRAKIDNRSDKLRAFR